MIQIDTTNEIIDSLAIIPINDSNLTDTFAKAPPTVEKLVSSVNLIPLNSVNNQWVFYWISIIGLLIILSKLLYPRQFHSINISLYSKKVYSSLQNESTIWRLPINIFLIIAYVLSVGLILYTYRLYYFNHLTYFEWDIYSALQISFAVFALIISKLFIVLITQITFQLKNLLRNYLNYLFISYSTLGIMLFFILWILIYGNFIIGLYISTATITIVYLVRNFKLLTLWNQKNNFNLFHFIIYLCTVEILPLIVFKKLYFIWFLNS